MNSLKMILQEVGGAEFLQISRWIFSLGAKDLVSVCQDADHVMVVGITCGLSAPYVAGQIDYAMQQQVCIQFMHYLNTIESRNV
jgi:N-acetylmuramic acid 6-phosphate (MurNAc-6-P) etherase